MTERVDPTRLLSQQWYHGGNDPAQAPVPIHVGTRRAAVQRIDPRGWDAGEGTHVPWSRLYQVGIKPTVRLHPLVHGDMEESARETGMHAGSLDFRIPRGYDAVAYRNEHEDEGNLSLHIHPAALTGIREVTDPHRGLRRRMRIEEFRLASDWAKSGGSYHPEDSPEAIARANRQYDAGHRF